MNIAKNMETIFCIAALVSVASLASAAVPAQQPARLSARLASTARCRS